MVEPKHALREVRDSSRVAESSLVNFHVLRWLALAWLVIWIPAYWRAWGWQNFLHLCDIAVILSCAGMILGSRLLISSQALATLLPGVVWCVDAGWRVFFGHHLVGGTEYLWNPSVPLWVRLLSLFHIGLPILLVAVCARIGYDRRALALQSAITASVIVISRWMGPAANLNSAFVDPVFQRALGPAPIHLTIIFAGTALLFYLPAHLFLSWKYSGKN